MNSYIFLGSSKFHNDCSKQNSIIATICGRRSVNIRTTVKRGLIFSSFLFFLLAYKFAFYAYNIFNNIIILNYFLTLRIFLFACKIFFTLRFSFDDCFNYLNYQSSHSNFSNYQKFYSILLYSKMTLLYEKHLERKKYSNFFVLSYCNCFVVLNFIYNVL